MRKFLIIAAVVLIAKVVFAGDFPAPVGHVNDFAEVMSAAERDEINANLTRFKEESKYQIAVVTVKSLNGRSVEEFTVNLAEEWGVGRKGNDDGLVLLVAPVERKIRIEVGRGIESIITDIYAKHVIKEMAPYFKEKKWAEGIKIGVNSLTAKFSGKVVVPDTESSADAGTKIVLGVLFSMIIAFIIIGIFTERRDSARSRTYVSTYDRSSAFLYNDLAHKPAASAAAIAAIAAVAASRRKRDDDDAYDNVDRRSSSYNNDDSGSSSSGFGGFDGGSFGGGGASGDF